MFFKEEAFPLSSEMVRSFAQTHYPDLTLHPKMVEQLSWLQNNSVNTSQSNVNLHKTPINIEVKRTLSRLNSLTLLIEGGSSAHTAFVLSQPIDNVLSEENFNRLSHFIQELSLVARKCLMATCFITKSDQAIMEVSAEKRNELPSDSEQFITHMVTHHPKLFPICALLDQESIDLLQYAFYKNTHARQMLDMEGGYNMVSDIAEAIRLRVITYEQYNLWFARWIINVAGLDGHVNHRGSIYLTESVANCIWALKLELDQLWLNPSHQVIDNYLMFRKKQLEVSGAYVAYLGALMRQYHPTNGLEIMAWFENLSEPERQKKINVFQTQLTETKVTPTFKPTVLVSLLELRCSISEALTIFTEIESQAMQVYLDAIVNGHISKSTPLSYRAVAYKESLIPIKDYYDRNHCLPEFTINSGGYLSLVTDALQKKASTVVHDGSDTYFLGTGDVAAKRLELQNAALLEESKKHIEKIPVLEGKVIWDIGCGSGAMTAYFAEKVGKTGHVYAVDISEKQLEVTKKRIEKDGFTNVTFIHADIVSGGFPKNAADIVYMRFVLMHLCNPNQALDKIKDLLKPEGMFVSEEPINSSCYSPTDANAILKEYISAYVEMGRKRGVNYDMGSCLDNTLNKAGFANTEVTYTLVKIDAELGKTMLPMFLDEWKDEAIRAEVTTEERIVAWKETISHLTNNRQLLFGHAYTMARALGQKSESSLYRNEDDVDTAIIPEGFFS